MGVAEMNARDHLLHDLQEILLGPLPDLSGRQRGGRVRDEQRAEPLLHLRLPDQRIDPVGQIHDLLAAAGADVQDLRHLRNDPREIQLCSTQ